MRLPRVDLSRLRGLSVVRDRLMHMSGRRRKIARYVGIGLLALVSFLYTLKFTFPYERVKDRLIETLSERYEVTIGDVGGGFFPGTVVFDDVRLKPRTPTPGEKTSEIVIDELVVDLGLDFGLIGALRKKAVLDIEAELGGGEINADLEISASLVEAHVETQALSLADVPGVAAAVGLPMGGALDAEIELRLPGAKWKNAEGKITLGCDDCTVGDGVSKMTMTPSTSSSGRRRRASAAAAAWGAQGVTVPRLALGDAKVVVDIDKGVGEIKTFAATSKDGWLKIEGKIEFRDPFSNTLFPGCMSFKLSDELKKRAPDFGNIEFTLSEKVRQADGSFAIPTKGRLTELRWDVRRKCGGGSAEDDGGDRSVDRPVLGDARPSLDIEPNNGPSTVDPAQVPGVSGQPDPGAGAEDPAAAEARGPAAGGLPQPVTSGQEMINGQTAAPHDAGAGAAPPPEPPPAQLERITPDGESPDQDVPPPGSENEPPPPPSPEGDPPPAYEQQQLQPDQPVVD